MFTEKLIQIASVHLLCENIPTPFPVDLMVTILRSLKFFVYNIQGKEKLLNLVIDIDYKMPSYKTAKY